MNQSEVPRDPDRGPSGDGSPTTSPRVRVGKWVVLVCTLSVLIAIGLALAGSSNSAGFTRFELVKQSATAFLIAMAVLAIPIALLIAALPGDSESPKTARSISISVFWVILGLVTAIVDFLVWILLALTFDPPSDDA